MHRHHHRADPPAPRASIALAPLALALAAGAVAATGDTGTPLEETPRLALPALGNTAEGDRPLLREIGDDHVHGSIGGGETDRVPASAPPAEDVWTRVRTATRLGVPENDKVRTATRTLRDEALWIGRILHRATPFVAHVVAALDARVLPLELALVPAVESGFRPHARSPNEASGLWQIVPLTAGEIGIERDGWYDGRADVVASTAAALDYLGHLNAEFHGDWELTLAAYNAGPGRVRRAVRRNRAAGLPEDFWSLALPSETLAYVPKFLGLLALIRADDGALELPRVALEPAFVKVDVGRRVSLEQAARIGGLPEPELRLLNAGLTHGVTPPSGPHELYLPREAEADFLSRLAAFGPGPLFASPRVHEVIAGDTLGEIARKYEISEKRLMALNDLENTRIRIGQRLDVRTVAATGHANVEHVVVGGDTLSQIADRYGVALEDITAPDGYPLPADLIRPGDTLLVSRVPSEAG